MRRIKFRGVGIDGRIYVGDLYHAQREVGIHVRGNGIWEVEPGTVAQLVYVGADGAEYYEGDTMIKDGQKWRVELCMRWQHEDDKISG